MDAVNTHVDHDRSDTPSILFESGDSLAAQSSGSRMLPLATAALLAEVEEQ